VRAVEFDGAKLRLVDRPEPEPGPGQVVVKVLGAGLCHSDVTLMQRPRDVHPFALPIVLGHEVAGTVATVGPGVTDVGEGDPVAVYGPRGCGRCRSCATGAENYCPDAPRLGLRPLGLGAGGGGLSELVLVDSTRHLVPLQGLDPVTAAPLTDAGVTPLHALRPSLAKLVPGSTVVLIGVGGLGHIALQLVRAVTAARVVAIDTAQDRLELARRLGANLAISVSGDPARTIRSSTRGVGADVVMDFVATDATLRLSADIVRPAGDIVIVGMGTGVLPVAMHRVPLGCAVRTPYWGTRADLEDVLMLALTGRVQVHVQTFALDDVAKAYEQLQRGQVAGRAVVCPAGV
jgi:alcohol dehydrogenase, propanol-preferring